MFSDPDDPPSPGASSAGDLVDASPGVGGRGTGVSACAGAGSGLAVAGSGTETGSSAGGSGVSSGWPAMQVLRLPSLRFLVMPRALQRHAPVEVRGGFGSRWLWLFESSNTQDFRLLASHFCRSTPGRLTHLCRGGLGGVGQAVLFKSGKRWVSDTRLHASKDVVRQSNRNGVELSVIELRNSTLVVHQLLHPRAHV